MYSKFWPKGGLPGILHHYTESLVTFEFTSSTIRKPHSLVFIGGLGEGLGSTSYMADLVRALHPTDWSIFTVNISSSHQSWGLGHLDRDTDEIAQCLNYVRDYKASKHGGVAGKLVLMGHSTGSQHVLHYLSRPNPHAAAAPAFDPDLQHVRRPALDGAIMQAPVSDREAMQLVVHHGWLGKTPAQTRRVFDELVAIAEEATKDDQACDFLLPLEKTSAIGYQNTPLSARRFLSLVSPESPQAPREDDLFSSDLGDEQLKKTFGMVRERQLSGYGLMVLVSGADQAVPDWVDKEKLMARWKKATDHDGEAEIWDEEFSGIIPNASHALSNDDQAECRKDLCERVMGYLFKVRWHEVSV
ncbi:siderophore biosynthesis lipase [Diplodia corticola]|uniref:Siderophore biosynthesis lipase n=1 Tax=Diplodia corticola TaxID=236234 RepID=A0A1J9QJX6_9PEZI|nr:siderophore biosynthesis lipase [Diplodia corticola]OJD28777.1 siderophore biosynthesis lipase [Diplodia corticola]